jgi:dehydrogenase/reductase SDR family protein 7B
MTTINHAVIWITGASGGIGEALAKACAKQGASVILSARRVEELERVKATLEHPDKHLTVALDVTDENACKQAMDTILARYGRLDWLINNAGISQRALILDTTTETDRRLFEVDFFAQVQLTRLALDALITHRGKVVFISSVAGLVGTQYRGSYSAAKAALHLWANALRAELGHTGLRVATVFPGFVKTDVSRNALTGDGSPLGAMDDAQAKAMTADEFAQKTLTALLKDKQYIVVGGLKERFATWVGRISPALLYRLIQKSRVR